LPELPDLPQTGIPLELVRRRPDVQTTYYYLQAADRDLASAISSRYPRLSLNLLLSTQGGVEDLFRQWAWSISGNLLAPIIYFGRLKAEATRNEAVRNQRLYEYGAAVLTAFREVEDALLLEMQQVKRIERIEKQHELALKAYDQLRIEYLNGMSNYLDVLTALEQEQELRRDLATARLVLLEYRVGLYRALAGAIDEEET
jgi:outer membrane protein TolC